MTPIVDVSTRRAYTVVTHNGRPSIFGELQPAVENALDGSDVSYLTVAQSDVTGDWCVTARNEQHQQMHMAWHESLDQAMRRLVAIIHKEWEI